MKKIKIEKSKNRRYWKINPATRIKPSRKLYQRDKSKKINTIEENEENNFHSDYTYCPICGAELVEKTVDNKKRKSCLVCGFVLYRNPAPASAAIIEKDGKTLLVKRKYPPFKGDWSLPAGFVEYGESPQDCAIRETYEETNLKVKLSSVFGVYSGQDDPRTHAILIVYLTENATGELKPGDDAEELGFFSQDEIPPNIAFSAHRQVFKEYFDFKKKTSQ